MGCLNLSTTNKRLFFALWPDSTVREKLYQLAQQIALEHNGRITRADTIHLTLLFAGHINADQQEQLEMVANEIQLPPFELSLNGVKHWKKPQVLWAGVSETPQPLSQLVMMLQHAAQGAEIKCDMRFHPHVTLLRKAREPLQFSTFEPVIWQVNDFVLIESRLEPDHVRYEILRRWPLNKNI